MNNDWIQGDEQFARNVTEGYGWQQFPKLFLELHGHQVQMPQLEIVPLDRRGEFLDSKDIIVDNKHTIEIKSRNEIFSYPISYPYKQIIVDTVSGYDGKKQKPLAYIMISKPTGSMICLMTSTYSSWIQERKFDNVKKFHDNFYLADRTLFSTMDELLEAL